MADNDEGVSIVRPETVTIPEVLPVLPLKDLVIFPFIIVPLSVSREGSIRSVDEALVRNRVIFLAAQKDFQTDVPEPDDIFTIGTVAIIMRMLRLPDGRSRILVQGLCRGRIERYVRTSPYFEAHIARIEEPARPVDLRTEAYVRTIKQGLDRLVALGKNISPEVMVIAANLDEPARLTDLAASNLDLKLTEAQEILETEDPLDRLPRVDGLIKSEINLLEMQQELSSAAQSEMNKSQREYFLRQQLKAIETELGEDDPVDEEAATYTRRLDETLVPPQARIEVEKQILRLRRLQPDSAEAASLRVYLDWMTSLQWSSVTTDIHDLDRAQKILDEEHYGLEDVKARILEYLAVRKLRGLRVRGQTLCFVGPPGVGKTSLGRAIARALDRRSVRIALGGVSDEAEIRGHRRSTPGAAAGRILEAIHQAQTSNSVIILDEMDKIGTATRGDPSAALLEVLDPEQNHSFIDRFAGVPYDLSQVMFIVTANDLRTIQRALLDRMEIIEVPGYTDDEKLQIARRHLIPRQVEENGIASADVSWDDQGIHHVICKYTNDPGIRNLERFIGAICRRIAYHVAQEKRVTHHITRHTVDDYLSRYRGPISFEESR